MLCQDAHTRVISDFPQVETIGDAYMVVAGAPEKTKYHAHNICDMALDMVRSIDHLKDPSNGNNIQIRVGGWNSFPPDYFFPSLMF